MKELLWLIPVLPLLGGLLNGVLLRNRLPKAGVTVLACGSVLLSFLVSMGRSSAT